MYPYATVRRAAASPHDERPHLMGRHNRRRHPPAEPLPDELLNAHPPSNYVPDVRQDPVDHYAVTVARQRANDIRVLEALIDWSVCCIPGCGDPSAYASRRESSPSEQLPLCSYHSTVIGKQTSERIHDEDHRSVRNLLNLRTIESIRSQERREAEWHHPGAPDGEIYFVKIGDLIKAGWSKRLYERLHNYGPAAEILCHYPGSRTDETLLHRNLRGELASGREWYHDTSAVRLFIANAIKQHGEPDCFPEWSEPKPPPMGGLSRPASRRTDFARR